VKSGRHEGDFAHSLTDLMSGVAVMFLVVAAIFMVQASQAKRNALEQKRRAEELAKRNELDASKYKEIDERDQQGIKEIEDLMATLSTNKNIELAYDKKKDPRLLTIVFNRDNLQFAPGACKVDDGRRTALRQTLQDIFPQICKSVGAGLQKSIALEGHTDNQPPLGVSCKGIESANYCYTDRTHERCKKQGFESNVQLSAARAQYVFFEAREALRLDQSVAQCLDKNFIVAGRGPMDPLDGGSWDKPRPNAENDKNRRVVIKVRVTAASMEHAAP
jgi:flagellar motor protein MotB